MNAAAAAAFEPQTPSKMLHPAPAALAASVALLYPQNKCRHTHTIKAVATARAHYIKKEPRRFLPNTLRPLFTSWIFDHFFSHQRLCLQLMCAARCFFSRFPKMQLTLHPQSDERGLGHISRSFCPLPTAGGAHTLERRACATCCLAKSVRRTRELTQKTHKGRMRSLSLQTNVMNCTYGDGSEILCVSLQRKNISNSTKQNRMNSWQHIEIFFMTISLAKKRRVKNLSAFFVFKCLIIESGVLFK